MSENPARETLNRMRDEFNFGDVELLIASNDMVLEIHAEDKDGWCSNCWDSSGNPIKHPCPTFKSVTEILGNGAKR